MSTISDLHDRAMELADAAEDAKRAGKLADAVAISKQALVLERDAAMMLLGNFDAEPTRSVLFRSAASLAVDSKDMVLAEQLVGLGLGGNPPAQVAEELRDLMEHVSFLRHLEVRGVVLEEEELQIAISGPAVDHGMASSQDFLTRVKVFENWVKKTAERAAKAQNWADAQIKAMKRGLDIYLSIPRPASFAISLRVGKPTTTQPEMKFDNFEAGLVDEILDEIEMVNEGRERELAERLGGEEEASVVMGFAKALAPVKGKIDTVGFTAFRGGRQRVVALRRQREDISLLRPSRRKNPNTDNAETLATEKLAAAVSRLLNQSAESANEPLLRITGKLKFVDATGEHPLVKLIDDSGVAHNILVSPDHIDSIVRPHWSEVVVITGHHTPEGIEFEDIERA